MENFGEILGWILKIAFVGIAVLMVVLILLQEGKGGGLTGLGGTKAAGVEGVTNPVRRATAYLAALWFILAIILGILAKGPSGEAGDEFYDAKRAVKKVAEKKDTGPVITRKTEKTAPPVTFTTPIPPATPVTPPATPPDSGAPKPVEILKGIPDNDDAFRDLEKKTGEPAKVEKTEPAKSEVKKTVEPEKKAEEKKAPAPSSESKTPEPVKP